MEYFKTFENFLFEDHEPLGFYVFIDEGEFDEYGEPEGEYQIGYSTLDVYAIPGGVDPHDSEEVDAVSDKRSEYKVIGQAKVKFWEGTEKLEVQSVTNSEVMPDDIEFLYPNL
jgi:hypothetical protein